MSNHQQAPEEPSPEGVCTKASRTESPAEFNLDLKTVVTPTSSLQKRLIELESARGGPSTPIINCKRVLQEKTHKLEKEVALLHEEKRTCLNTLGKGAISHSEIDEVREGLKRGALVAFLEAMWREDRLRKTVLRLKDSVPSLESHNDRARKHYIYDLEYENRWLQSSNRRLDAEMSSQAEYFQAHRLENLIIRMVDLNQQLRVGRDQWLHRYYRFVPLSELLVEDRPHLLDEPSEQLDENWPDYLDEPPEAAAAIYP